DTPRPCAGRRRARPPIRLQPSGAVCAVWGQTPRLHRAVQRVGAVWDQTPRPHLAVQTRDQTPAHTRRGSRAVTALVDNLGVDDLLVAGLARGAVAGS